jgi:two-component system, sensor histidine kinase
VPTQARATIVTDEKRAVWAFTLRNMVTAPVVLYGSWLSAGLILTALGRPRLALVFCLLGIGFDTWAQRRVRRYRLEEPPANGWPLTLMIIVAGRFSLGVWGPLAAWMIEPKVDVMLVVLLIQAWSICVALVQFSSAPRLLWLAAAPIFMTVLVVIYPSLTGRHGLAVAGAVVLLAAILIIIARATDTLWHELFAADQRNKLLLEEVQVAHDEALAERDAARAARREADEANAAKSRFLANMSHEIRTPLNGVIGMAQVMAGDDLEERQRSRLSIVQRSAETLLDLINQILDLSRIEAGRLDVVVQPVDVDALIEEVAATLTPLAESKGLSFRVKAPRLGWVGTDPVRLRQILFNLLSNAIKFTNEGEVALDVAVADGQAVFTVSDTGRGIPADQIDRLFLRFAQIEAGAEDRRDGAGLGLSIVAALVDLLGGRIAVESKPGRGAAFVVTLPLAAVETRGDRTDHAGEPDQDAQALRVLVAEDHPVNQQVIRELLRQVGVEVEIVEDGQAAVEAVQAQVWDLILMDVQMPRMDGPSATRAIRAREAAEGLSRVPIIALTANTMVDQIDGYIAAGMDAVVGKPVDLRLLLTTIGDVMTDNEPAGAAD